MSFDDISTCWDNMTRKQRKRILLKTSGGKKASSRNLDDLSRTELFDFSDNMKDEIERAMLKSGSNCFK